MDRLPAELLLKILTYLPPTDRLNCSLMSRRFAELASSSKMLENVVVNIPMYEMNRAFSVMSETQRQYVNLVVYGVLSCDYDDRFWNKIGGTLRVLELDDCSLRPEIFLRILQLCPNLDSLKLGGRTRDIFKDIELAEGGRLEKLPQCSSSLRRLHLDFEVTRKVLKQLIGLTPNITQLILKRIGPGPGLDYLEHLSEMTKKMQIELGIGFCVDSQPDEIAQFLIDTADNLRELRITWYTDRMEEIDLMAAIGGCTKLRHLTFETASWDRRHCRPTTIRIPTRLIANSTDLETLELITGSTFSDDFVHCLGEMKKLRRLCLKETKPRETLNRNGFIRELGNLSTLEELELHGVPIDSKILGSMAVLKNLKKLVIHSLESECFEIVCNTCLKLKELWIAFDHIPVDQSGEKLCQLKELRILKLTFLQRVSDIFFERGIGPPSLEHLDIRCVPSMAAEFLTDHGLRCIAVHHGRLRKFFLTHCRAITDGGLLSFLRREPHLIQIRLKGCYLSPEWVAELESSFPRLYAAWRFGPSTSNF